MDTPRSILAYEPIRAGERYIRRPGRCPGRRWPCIRGIKQRLVLVLQPSGVHVERWINAAIFLAFIIRKLHLVRPDLIPYPMLIETYA